LYDTLNWSFRPPIAVAFSQEAIKNIIKPSSIDLN